MATQNIKPKSKIDVYASLQITKNKLFFIVTHYKRKTKRKVIVFKKCVEGLFLDDKDVILNKTHTKNTLYDCIGEYELEFKNTIIGIILILPTKTLDIRESEQFKASENSNQITATSKLKEELLNAVANDMHKSTKTVVKYKPEYWEFDGERTFDYAYDQKFHKIKLKGKNFSIDTDVLNSHKNVVIETGRQIICAEFDNFATAFRVIPQPSFLYNSVILFDINNEYTSISFILHETCFKYVYSNNQLTLNEIIKPIATALSIKEKAANNYLYNLIDFEENNSTELVYFRKLSNNEHNNIELNKKQIMDIFEKNIKKIIESIDAYLESETSHPEKIEVYITGQITKISGIGSIIKDYSKYANQIKLYMPFVIGEKNTEDTVSLGTVEYVISSNENKRVTKYMTSTYIKNKVEEAQKNITKDGFIVNGEEIEDDIFGEIPTGYSVLPNADIEQLRFSLENVKKSQLQQGFNQNQQLVNDTVRNLNNIPNANINMSLNPNNLVQNQQYMPNNHQNNIQNQFANYQTQNQYPNIQVERISNPIANFNNQYPNPNNFNNNQFQTNTQMNTFNQGFNQNIVPNNPLGVYNMVRENNQQNINMQPHNNRVNNMYNPNINYNNQQPINNYNNQQNNSSINQNAFNQNINGQINPYIKKY